MLMSVVVRLAGTIDHFVLTFAKRKCPIPATVLYVGSTVDHETHRKKTKAEQNRKRGKTATAASNR